MIIPKIIRFSHLLHSGIMLDDLWRSDEIAALPTYIGIAVEERCFFRCKHCRIWKEKKHQGTLSFDNLRKILIKLKSWTGGKVGISLSGGEPFLNPETIPTICFASKLGFFVSTTSNGFLIDDRKSKEIVDSGLKNIAISLDFPDAVRHNKFRGSPLAYERAVAALSFLKQRNKHNNLRIKINTVMMRQNLTDLTKMVIFAARLGIDGITFQPLYETFATPSYNPFWYRNSSLWPIDKKQINQTINDLIILKRQGYAIDNTERQLEMNRLYFTDYAAYIRTYRCYVGATSFLIDRFGKVRLCYFFEPIGNILKDDPKNIWNNQQVKLMRQKCRACPRGCRILLCNSPLTARDIFLRVVKKLSL